MKNKNWKLYNKKKEDKILIKVEEYVEKDREKIHKAISEKKHEKRANDEESMDLEVIMGRLYEKDKTSKKGSTIAKGILYGVYIILICTTIYVYMKYFTNSTPKI